MRELEGLRDTIHCTEEERYHLRALIALGLHDGLRLFPAAQKFFVVGLPRLRLPSQPWSAH